jgi:predicted membrane protein
MPLLYFVVALMMVIAVAILVNSAVRLPGNIMPVVNAVLALIVVGMVLWLINTYVPMAESIKAILNVVVVVATCVFVLQAVGLWDRVVNMSNSAWARITKPRPATDAPKVPESAEQH